MRLSLLADRRTRMQSTKQTCLSTTTYVRNGSRTAETMKYPETRRVEQVDEFHGVKVPDPYRWLEADVRESPEVAEWVKQQNEVARAYLGRHSAAAGDREAAHRALELRALLAADAGRRQVLLLEERRAAESIGAVRGRFVRGRRPRAGRSEQVVGRRHDRDADVQRRARTAAIWRTRARRPAATGSRSTCWTSRRASSSTTI